MVDLLTLGDYQAILFGIALTKVFSSNFMIFFRKRTPALSAVNFFSESDRPSYKDISSDSKLNAPTLACESLCSLVLLV